MVASGPSAPGVHLKPANGAARFIAVKTSIELCPWADILHAADFSWWNQHQGRPDFAGVKTTLNRRASEAPWGVQFLRSNFTTGMEFDDPGRVGWGGNSGFGAVNLAAQFGASKIILIGFDMRIDLGARWHAPHGAGSAEPVGLFVENWRRHLDDAASDLAARSIRVVNCSPISALRAYPIMPFEAALAI